MFEAYLASAGKSSASSDSFAYLLESTSPRGWAAELIPSTFSPALRIHAISKLSGHITAGFEIRFKSSELRQVSGKQWCWKQLGLQHNSSLRPYACSGRLEHLYLPYRV